MVDYRALLNQAVVSVVRQIMLDISKNGLSGGHYLYISFLTNDIAVKIPERVLKAYPEEMTIILQYEFRSLIVHEHFFAVKISFNGIEEDVEVPFRAITSFSDPSVNFSLGLIPQIIKRPKIMEEKSLLSFNEEEQVPLSPEEINHNLKQIFRKKTNITKKKASSSKKNLQDSNIIVFSDYLKKNKDKNEDKTS